MKVSLIMTVYNESGTLEQTLGSIRDQTVVPDEVVVVDGGSTDGTVDVLHEWESELPLTVIEEECNIAEGRNIAVEQASHDHILGTDGGCVLDEDWVAEMTAGFEESDCVAGLFRPLEGSLFQRVQGRIMGGERVAEEIRAGRRGPSSRAIGFTRAAWQDVGGYPEDLYTGEDTKFNRELQDAGHEFAVADAWVSWEMRPTWGALWDQFHRYGRGDAEAGNLLRTSSRRFGLSKQLLQLLDCNAALVLSMMTVWYLLLGGWQWQLTGAGALAALAVPTLYFWKDLYGIAREEGPYGLLVGIGVTQARAWGWWSGFTTWWSR